MPRQEASKAISLGEFSRMSQPSQRVVELVEKLNAIHYQYDIEARRPAWRAVLNLVAGNQYSIKLECIIHESDFDHYKQIYSFNSYLRDLLRKDNYIHFRLFKIHPVSRQHLPGIRCLAEIPTDKIDQLYSSIMKFPTATVQFKASMSSYTTNP